MIWVILITLFSAYVSLGIGTIKKFKTNRILLSMPMKMIALLLPLAIFILHLKMACEVFRVDRHRAWDIMKMATLHYPVAIGILIEVTLENFAQKKVFGESLSHVKKQPINISANTLKSQKTSVFGIYERATANLPA